MPVLTGIGCLVSSACPEVVFPQSTQVCVPTLAAGGVNDLYFIPCGQTLSATNITDLAWWTLLINGNSGATPAVPVKLGRVGIGMGSIGKKGDKKERIGSSRVEQIISMTWALKYVIKAFDKTSADATRLQMNELISKFNKYLVVARMSDGDDNVLPIGQFTTSDFNWIVPDNFEDIQTVEFELSWMELAMPKVYTVAGLSAILPKAA